MRFRESLWRPFGLTFVVFTDMTVKVRVSCDIRAPMLLKSAYLARESGSLPGAPAPLTEEAGLLE